MDRLKTNRIGNMDDGQAENNPPIFGSVASPYLIVVLDLGNIF